MIDLTYLKKVLSDANTFKPTMYSDEILNKYGNILRYVIKYIQQTPKAEDADVLNYIHHHYPELSEQEQYTIQEFAILHSNDAKVINKLFAPNFADNKTTLLDVNDLNLILNGIERYFKEFNSAPDINSKSMPLDKLNSAVVELERTYQALAKGLEENKLIELKK